MEQEPMALPEYDYFNPSHRINLLQEAAFELKSWLGRKIIASRPPKNEGRWLHLGCGPRLLKGWVNADFFGSFLRPNKARPEWQLDLRYPFLCQDDYWAGVFCEHTLEHLYPHEALRCLRELHRTMQPGAWCRVVVPSLAKYIDYYHYGSSEPQFTRWSLRAAALQALAHHHGHRSLWDEEMMIYALQTAGFNEVQACEFRQGNQERLLEDSPSRAWESLYVEGRKAEEGNS